MKWQLLTLIGLILGMCLLTSAGTASSEQEPNDTKSIADPVNGGIIRGEIGRNGDRIDWFRLSGDEGINPTFTLTYDSSNGTDLDLYVYNANEKVGDTVSQTRSPETVSCNVPGQCYVRVYAYRGQGNYTIRYGSN